MTTQQWRKLQMICKAAAKLNGTGRSAYLDRQCQGNDELRQQVDSRLPYYFRSSAFLGLLSSGGHHEVAHYRVVERIGDGGMGLVFKAMDTRLNRFVALKAMPPWTASSTAARNLLLKEAQFACKLNHPNIVTIYEILKQENADYIVMEYLPGRNLKDFLPEKGLGVCDAIQYAIYIADALSHAHSAGVLHRDLKPSNIFITDQNRVKLLDFGLAVPLTGGEDQEPQPVQDWGTSAYMAPEQFRESSPDPRSDQFSFGIILWEMLTGKHPFGAGSREEIRIAIQEKTFAGRSQKVTTQLKQVVSRCLEKEPLSRFPTMHEVRSALLAIKGTTNGTDFSASITNLEFSTASGIDSSGDMKKARAAIVQMNSESLSKCRDAAEILRTLLGQNDSEELHTLVRRSMRDLLLSTIRFKAISIPAPVRAIRGLALEVHRHSSLGELHLYFRNTDFDCQDLFEMDFSVEPLAGFQFNRSFLVGSSFRSCDLTNCSFECSRIRNVDFAGATLSGATFSGADWFNALNLTGSQIEAVSSRSLMECPSDEAGMRLLLERFYGLPFASWGTEAQQELLTAWKEYLRPSGLRDYVHSLRLSLA